MYKYVLQCKRASYCVEGEEKGDGGKVVQEEVGSRKGNQIAGERDRVGTGT